MTTGIGECMFIKSNKGYYFWEEFFKLGVVNGFSIRQFGDMSRINPNSYLSLNKFCKALGIDKKQTVGMEQVHGDKISFVSEKNLGIVIPDADGLVSSKSGVFLMVKSADCVPVLFFDKNKKIFGIVHAGWKGAYKEIVKIMVSEMVAKGSIPLDIIVGIGPSIRVCCYNINKEREDMFKNKFTKWQEKILEKRSNQIFLDSQALIKLQLKECGILNANIKDCMICTKDNLDFYSYRRAKNKDSFDRFAGLIGLK